MLSRQQKTSASLPEEKSIKARGQNEVDFELKPGHSFEIQIIPVIEELFSIIAAHNDQPFIPDDTRRMELAGSWNLTPLSALYELFIGKSHEFVLANWHFSILTQGTSPTPEEDLVLEWKDGKPLQKQAVFGPKGIERHGLAVHSEGRIIVLTGDVDSSEDKNVLID